jgi:hypothetical protein
MNDTTEELPGWRPGADLTPLEKRMLAGAEAGELLDLGDGPFTEAEMQAWKPERAIRASVLRHLIVANEWPIDAKGVRLRGVRITEQLDIEGVTLLCSLSLNWCYLDASRPGTCLDRAAVSRVAFTNCQMAGLTAERLTAKELDLARSRFTATVRLPGASLGRLDCSGAQLTGHDDDGNALVADGLKADGDMFLSDGFTAAGAVRLSGADLTGQLNCAGAQLTGRDNGGNVLVADQLKVGGDAFLNDGFTAAGAVRLLGANITGQLNCAGAQLTGHNNDGNALVADQLKVGGSLFLSGGFTAAGAVRLSGGNITGLLTCAGAQLTGRDNDGDALVADGLKAKAVFLIAGFTAAGAVRLPGAEISAQFGCRGAQLTGHDNDGDTLFADGLKTGDVFLDGGFTAAGSILLRSARISGSLYAMPKSLADGKSANALDARDAQIEGTLRWRPSAQVTGRVSLQGATAGQLEDYWNGDRANAYWPVGGHLNLNGFIYNKIGGSTQATVEQRLKWIRSQYRTGTENNGSVAFATQPYEQLAAVYQQAGQETQARKVAIARRVDLRTYGNLNWYRMFGNWLLDKTIKYGYQAWRAGVGLAAVFVAFALLSFFAQQHHLMVPVGDIDALHFVPSATQCTSSYPCFYPAGYAVDTVIPIINVHQSAYWGPNGNASWGHAWVACTWIATALGWALATLLVAGYTGLVRQD